LPLAVSVGKSHLAQKRVGRAITWPGPPLSVLVVEDEQINVQYLTALLAKMGLPYKVAANGREGLQALENETFNVVLMDIQMPVMNGEAALREIRRREEGQTARQMVIAVTAYALRGDKERFLANGFDGYLSKPVNVGELIATLKRLTAVEERPEVVGGVG
jgi:CheY-like chemotaxis protein